MNFKSNKAYKKWLGYGHASGEFAKTPGHQSVSIKGKPKSVKHEHGGRHVTQDITKNRFNDREGWKEIKRKNIFGQDVTKKIFYNGNEREVNKTKNFNENNTSANSIISAIGKLPAFNKEVNKTKYYTGYGPWRSKDAFNYMTVKRTPDKIVTKYKSIDSGHNYDFTKEIEKDDQYKEIYKSYRPWKDPFDRRNREVVTNRKFNHGGPHTTPTPTSTPTYADSLALYENSLAQQAYYNTLEPYYGDISITPDIINFNKAKNAERATLNYNTSSFTSSQQAKFDKLKKIISENKDPNIAYITDIVTGALDPNAPALRYDKNIMPQGTIYYTPYETVNLYSVQNTLNNSGGNRMTVDGFLESRNFSKDERDIIYALADDLNNTGKYASMYFNNKEGDLLNWIKSKGLDPNALKKLLDKQQREYAAQLNLPGNFTDLPYYDPIAVKPGSMLTDDEIIERYNKYGPKGIPESKLQKLKSLITTSSISIKPKGTTDPNISVDVRFRKLGLDSSFANRKKVAEQAGIENYKGTAEQNKALNQWVVENYNPETKTYKTKNIDSLPIKRQTQLTNIRPQLTNKSTKDSEPKGLTKQVTKSYYEQLPDGTYVKRTYTDVGKTDNRKFDHGGPHGPNGERLYETFDIEEYEKLQKEYDAQLREYNRWKNFYELDDPYNPTAFRGRGGIKVPYLATEDYLLDQHGVKEGYFPLGKKVIGPGGVPYILGHYLKGKPGEILESHTTSDPAYPVTHTLFDHDLNEGIGTINWNIDDPNATYSTHKYYWDPAFENSVTKGDMRYAYEGIKSLSEEEGLPKPLGYAYGISPGGAPNIPIYAKPVKPVYKQATLPRKEQRELESNIPNKLVTKSEPKLNLHREYNPYTQQFEVMSPRQKRMLDRAKYLGQDAPEFKPEPYDAITIKPLQGEELLKYRMQNDPDFINIFKYGGSIPNIPTWNYPSKGTPIYRDTSEIPPVNNFRAGGFMGEDPPAKDYSTIPGVNKEKLTEWNNLNKSEPTTVEEAKLLAEAVGYTPQQAIVVAAQWALESGRGKHTGGDYNYFGIKSHNQAVRNRMSDLYGLDLSAANPTATSEYEGGKNVSTTSSFMNFANPIEAFLGHKAFLETNSRYVDALNKTTSAEFAQELQKAGYATDPNYSKLLRDIAVPVVGEEAYGKDAETPKKETPKVFGSVNYLGNMLKNLEKSYTVTDYDNIKPVESAESTGVFNPYLENKKVYNLRPNESVPKKNN